MAENSNIAWTDDTWNPWRGCTKVSAGCKNCYAEVSTPVRVARDNGLESWGKGAPRIRAGKATLHDPIKWNKKPWVCDSCGNALAGNESHYWDAPPTVKCYCRPGVTIQPAHRRRVFSLSLGDWLDDEVPIEWLADMLDTIRRCPNLDFLLLTKRPENFKERINEIIRQSHDDLASWVAGWVEGHPVKNVWLGVSVENQKAADERIPLLLKIPANARFLSVEPLLDEVDLPFIKSGRLSPTGDNQESRVAEPPSHIAESINWVIVGGESGANRRDCGVDAITDVADQCTRAAVPCFVKQDCAFKPGQQGRIPDAVWKLKQFPEVPR